VSKAGPIGLVLSAVALIVVLAFGSSLYYVVDAGEYVIVQGSGFLSSSELRAESVPGYHLKDPFAKITEYKKVVSVSYTKIQDRNATSINPPFHITFNDTYAGQVTGSFRFRLPTNPKEMIRLHEEVQTFENLVESTLEKQATNLLSYTANQFSGEDYMQGGQNSYQSRLQDQASNGLFITKRVAVKVSKQVADTTSNKKVSTGEAIVHKTTIQLDKDGVRQREGKFPLTVYGITVSQITIDGFYPDPKLKMFVNNKKDRVQERAKLIEEQENERQRAITANLKGDRERIEAKQRMLQERDAEVIQADKRVELEKKSKEIAVVKKQKELEVAQADLGIQRAKAESAIQEAKAIKARGLAEAAVTKAKYSAFNRDIYLAEMQRDIAKVMYQNLKDLEIKMPSNVIVSGGQGQTSLQDLTNLTILDKFKEIGTPAPSASQ